MNPEIAKWLRWEPEAGVLDTGTPVPTAPALWELFRLEALPRLSLESLC